VQDVLPAQLTRTLIVAPEVLMCLTVARSGVVPGLGVAMIGVEWPLLAKWVLSPV